MEEEAKVDTFNDEERLKLERVVIHNIPAGLEDYENYYFPINHYQTRDLLGKILTQVESMNLNDRSEKACKAIFTQMVWRWFDGVMENSVTASPNTIQPIDDRDFINRIIEPSPPTEISTSNV